MTFSFDSKYTEPIVSTGDLDAITPRALEAYRTLMSGNGEGNDKLGWLDLPVNYDKKEFAQIKEAAEFIKKNADVLIVIGIGGSYLGARAVIEGCKSANYNLLTKDTPQIFFIGNSISPSSLNEVLMLCKDKEIAVNVISKSGNTTEPAIAFRVFRELINSKYSPQEAAKRIFCTTDKNKGTLKALADKEDYKTFVVPDDIGGRYSVLTAVGLLPIAVAGVDIDRLMKGAECAMNELNSEDINNPAIKYAAIRNCLYEKGKSIECFVSYEPSMAMFNEWLKQLFGESEGKDGKGLFPTSTVFSTDLHSLGQFIQDSGAGVLFESVIKFNNTENDYIIKTDDENADGLNFLAGEKMSAVNEKARLGTLLAHTEGGVANLVFEFDRLDEFNLGYLIYFFEKACAVSGYILGVNPFDQPGVESYKKNMFALLGKPGYEDEKERLENLLGL